MRDAHVQRLIKLAREVAEIGSAGCAFWACDGPDHEPVPMKTCHCCWAVHDARVLLRDIGE
jgi:hypothetical protein